MSALLPLLMYAMLAIGFAMAFQGSAQHRAVAWVQAGSADQAALAQAVAAHRVFAHGRREAAGAPPAGCAGFDTAISFGRLQSHELAAAHEALLAVARAQGLPACPHAVFRFNELPAPADAVAAADALPIAAWVGFAPLAAVFGMFWAFVDRLRLRASVQRPAWRARALRDGLLAGLGLALLARGFALAGIGGPGLLAGAGPGALALLLLAWPLLQETAFRAWALPLAERAIGPGAALAATFLLQWLLVPAPPDAALAMAVQGTALGLLYLRTRSLPACVLAQSLACAGAFA